ncbi:MAG: conjugal transfer protein TraF, partial [bacterium]
LTGELNDVTKDGQGILANVTAGVNGRKGGWGIVANNFTSFSVYSTVSLDQVLIGNEVAADSTAREFLSGDSTTTDISNSDTPDQISTSTRDNIANAFDNAFNTVSGVNNPQDLGFSGSTNSQDMANKVSQRIEGSDAFQSDSVTESDINKAIDVLAPNVVALGADTGSSFDTEDQNAVSEGVAISEIGFSYAHPKPLVDVLGGPLYGGVNLKYMRGDVGYKEQNIFEDVNDDDYSDNVKTTNTFGIDVGLLYDRMEDQGYRIGLVGKNINGPEFDYPSAADTAGKDVFEVDPQFRLGFSGYPMRVLPVEGWGKDWWKMSVDYDITETGTSLPNYDNQYVNIGNEFNVYNRPWLNLALRAGAKKNLSESSEGSSVEDSA